MTRYYEALFETPAVRIMPGEFFVTSEDIAIVTLLGSCVAACVRDTRTGMIGMNHFMLPQRSTHAAVDDLGRYGNSAMSLVVDAMVQKGADPQALTAKVFGGGGVVDGRNATMVGRNNAAFVLDDLQARGIEVLAADLRGDTARKIFFVQRSGEVHVHYLHGRPACSSRS